MMKQMLDVSKRTNETMLKALETGIDASEQTTGVTKSAVDAYFNALEASVPGNAEGIQQLRESVHEQIDAGNEIQAETWSAVHELAEQSVEAADEFADNYSTVVDDSYDAFLESHERLEEQTVSAAESVEVPIDAE
jgi:nucleoid-associated protein YejK